MIFEVLVCPGCAAPECPLDQSYERALIVSSLYPSFGKERHVLGKDRVIVVERH